MTKHQKNRKYSLKKWTIGSVTMIVLLILFDVFMTGNITYIFKWRECGQQPVVIRHPWSIGFGASPQKTEVLQHPSFFDEKSPLFNVANTSLLCSLDEAKQKYGGSPHLDLK